MPSSIASALLLVPIACWTAASQAVPVTFHYAGTVSFAPEDSSLQLVGKGTPLSVRLSFESSTRDQVPDETLGVYPGAITGFTVVLPFASYVATKGDAQIDTSFDSGRVLFDLSDLSGPDIGGWTLQGGLLAFNVPRRPEVLPNDDLPLRPLDPLDFDETFMNLVFLAPGADPDCTLLEECLKFVWAVNALYLVPEPGVPFSLIVVLAPILLLAAGCMARSLASASHAPRYDSRMCRARHKTG